jgi:hypothetical protein
VLWKFAGLSDGVEATRERLTRLANGGWTVPPLADALGFVATPWVEGRPLSRSDVTFDLLWQMEHYIRDAAGPPLEAAEQRRSFERLVEMLAVNMSKGMGESTSRRALARVEAVRLSAEATPVPAYGDGRMAPHEWIRTLGGQLVKVDCTGHDADHTLVGRQPLVWDVVGAVVEWDFSDDESAALILSFGYSPDGVPMLDFYHLAYAAFRMGQCVLCAEMASGEPHEQVRLRTAADFYRRHIEGVLNSPRWSGGPSF